MRTLIFLLLTIIYSQSFGQLIIDDFRKHRVRKQNQSLLYQQNQKYQRQRVQPKYQEYLEPEEYPRTELRETTNQRFRYSNKVSESEARNYARYGQVRGMEDNDWLYTGESGGEGGFPFEHILPVNSQIMGVKVFTSERNPYVAGLEIYYLDTRRVRRVLLIGHKTRAVNSFAIPRGAKLVAISGQAGRFLNSIKFHFSDGTASHRYGARRGSRNFYMEVPQNAKVVGFYGGSADYIDRIGLIGEF
jgi:hypothetical protein